MIKLMTIVTASALALSLSSVAFGADEKTQDQPAAPKMQNEKGSPATQDPAGTPAELSKQDQEYLAALKKCEGAQDAARQKCIEQAKSKYNHM